MLLSIFLFNNGSDIVCLKCRSVELTENYHPTLQSPTALWSVLTFWGVVRPANLAAKEPDFYLIYNHQVDTDMIANE